MEGLAQLTALHVPCCHLRELPAAFSTAGSLAALRRVGLAGKSIASGWEHLRALPQLRLLDRAAATSGGVR